MSKTNSGNNTEKSVGEEKTKKPRRRRFFSKTEMDPRDRIIEVISASVIALATVSSAWSAYQATRWSGLQSILFSEATAARVEGSRLNTTVNQIKSFDVGLFVHYAGSYFEKNEEFTEFLYNRFPPRLKTAVDAWIATQPLKNPDAPSSPFVMEVYVVPEEKQSEEMGLRAEAKTEEAKAANQRSDNYILLTVLFASVLFFGGVGTKFESRNIRWVIIVLGCIVLFIALGILTSFPVQ